MANMNISRKVLNPHSLAVVALVLVAIGIKILYLNTAESRFNTEELPLSAIGLVGGTDAVVNVASSRLYGTTFITTAISLGLFGFSVFALKAPNILFFLLSLGFLYLFWRRYAPELNRWYFLFSSALLCLGPPVVQIWSMKNRGGFIENIFALVLCLWICARAEDGRLSDIRKLLLAVIIGLAAWSQPMAIIWGGVLCAYVVLAELDGRSTVAQSARRMASSSAVLAIGLILGTLPLIALNFLFRFNTFRVLEGGELPGGVDLGKLGRLQQLMEDGIPRLLGLKEQWNSDWLLPFSASLALYILFLWPATVAALNTIIEAQRRRKFTLGAAIVAIALALLAANVISSWGNFQGEPRRLLLLYVPFAILTVQGLSRMPKVAIGFLCLWVVFNLWSNYLYISKHPDGFSHRLYLPLDKLADFLESEQIEGVYADVWTGSRVSFASKGTIPWFRSRYVRTNYGFRGDEVLTKNEALLFNPVVPGGEEGRRKLWRDLQTMGHSCSERQIGGIWVVYGCSGDVTLRKQTPRSDERPREPREVALDVTADDPRILVAAGKREDGAIVANGQPGFLIYGPYLPLPAGEYLLQIEGISPTQFTVDIAASRGKEIMAQARYLGNSSPEVNIMAALKFEIAHPVDDVEFRIQVPLNSGAKITRYRVLRY